MLKTRTSKRNPTEWIPVVEMISSVITALEESLYSPGRHTVLHQVRESSADRSTRPFVFCCRFIYRHVTRDVNSTELNVSNDRLAILRRSMKLSAVEFIRGVPPEAQRGLRTRSSGGSADRWIRDNLNLTRDDLNRLGWRAHAEPNVRRMRLRDCRRPRSRELLRSPRLSSL